jgi:hypothetical protein
MSPKVRKFLGLDEIEDQIQSGRMGFKINPNDEDDVEQDEDPAVLKDIVPDDMIYPEDITLSLCLV